MPALPFRSLCAKLRAAIKAMEIESGVDRSCHGPHAARLMARQPVNAADFLGLCATLGFDPLTGEARHAPQGTFQGDLLAMGCAVRRHVEGLSLRAAARKCRVSHPTLYRFEHGHTVSAEAVLKIAAFYGLHPFDYLETKLRRAA